MYILKTELYDRDCVGVFTDLESTLPILTRLQDTKGYTTLDKHVGVYRETPPDPEPTFERIKYAIDNRGRFSMNNVSLEPITVNPQSTDDL